MKIYKLCIRQFFDADNKYSGKRVAPYIKVEAEDWDDAEKKRLSLFRGKQTNHGVEGMMVKK